MKRADIVPVLVFGAIGIYLLLKDDEDATVKNSGLTNEQFQDAVKSDPLLTNIYAAPRILAADSNQMALNIGAQQVQLQSGLDLTNAAWNLSTDNSGNYAAAQEAINSIPQDSFSGENPFRAFGYPSRYPVTIAGVTIYNKSQYSALRSRWDSNHRDYQEAQRHADLLAYQQANHLNGY